MAVGFGTSPRDSWVNVDRSDWSGFYCDATQQYLLPYFTVDGEAVDPYDGAVFSGAQLNTLANQLRAAVTEVETFPQNWPFTNQDQVDRYFSRCQAYGIHPHQPRYQALRTLNEGIALAQKALRLNHFLIFCGD